MRIASACVVSVLLAVGAAACSAPEPTRPYQPESSTGKPSKGNESSGDATPEPGANDNADPAPSPTPDPKGTSPADSDGDGVADSEDCDPASPTVAERLLEDDLSTEKGLFATVDGFPQTSWSYGGAAYRQGRAADAADTSVLVKAPSVGDVLVEVRAASTEVAAITPRLRQMFIVLGTKMTAGQLSAVGCGVEVAQGEAMEQKTSVVRLSGAPGAVATTVLQRVDRAPLQVNEEFTVKARLSKGTLTCEVTQGATTTTATASGLGNLEGAVGFFTRQTKALFKQARICRLK